VISLGDILALKGLSEDYKTIIFFSKRQLSNYEDFLDLWDLLDKCTRFFQVIYPLGSFQFLPDVYKNRFSTKREIAIFLSANLSPC